MPGPKLIARIVSGGQTGVDRAALDTAIALGVPCGGWCPNGRKSEDGVIPSIYRLKETSTGDYAERTRLNVQDSDGTLILGWGELSGGTLLTLEECRKQSKPVLVIDLAVSNPASIEEARAWIVANLPSGLLNVAGPRASTDPTVYEQARLFMVALLERCDWP